VTNTVRQNNDVSRALPWGPRTQTWMGGLFIFVATLIVYLPALRAQFVWDDDSWTSKIIDLLRDVRGLGLMWCQPTALQQYYPLTGTTFWLDYQVWGFRPLPYHLENVLLHALGALLFWRLLRRLRVPGAWLASAIFALHPVMVESAAWITERKNVLSLVFYLGSLLAYGHFAHFWQSEQDPPSGAADRPSRRWRTYAWAWLLFLAAYLSKATAFSLPAVLLLIAWWKRERIQWRRDVLPSLPFFAAAISLGMLTVWLERNHVGAKGEEWAIPFAGRCLIAGRAIWFYIGKLLWPFSLCFVYPQWQLNTALFAQWLYPATATSAVLGLWLARKRVGRGPVTAVFFFVGTLLPVLGFMNSYFMRFSFVCDHWVYLPSLGLLALGAALMVRAADFIRLPTLQYGFAAVVLTTLGVATWHQSQIYFDTGTLWRATIAGNPNCWMAHNNLANILRQEGQVDEAIVHVREALAICPENAELHCNLGELLLLAGKLDEAIAHFQQALTIQPGYWSVRLNLGAILLQRGHVPEAIEHLQKFLQVLPNHAEANHNLGVALLRNGQLDEAIGRFQKALQVRPAFAAASCKLGDAFMQKGQLDQAIACYQKALEIQPNFADASYNLGSTLLQKGFLYDAMAYYQQAIESQPANAFLLNNLAWVLATCPKAVVRNGARAVELAQQAERLTGRTNLWIIGTLAAAYAEDGRFPEAVATAQRALDWATSQTDPAQINALREQMGQYRAGLPIRDASQTRPIAPAPERPSSAK
jgi:protein O-mannosyl-transferase